MVKHGETRTAEITSPWKVWPISDTGDCRLSMWHSMRNPEKLLHNYYNNMIGFGTVNCDDWVRITWTMVSCIPLQNRPTTKETFIWLLTNGIEKIGYSTHGNSLHGLHLSCRINYPTARMGLVWYTRASWQPNRLQWSRKKWDSCEYLLYFGRPNFENPKCKRFEKTVNWKQHNYQLYFEGFN